MQPPCACDHVFFLDGNEADAYADEHLIEDAVDDVNWTVAYHCPLTSRKWLRDSPSGALQGGGPPRLRQLDEHGLPLTR